MVKISRSDLFVNSEKGGAWFDEFLRICKDQEQLLKVITNKKSEGVAELVKEYREAVGLDLIKNASTDPGSKENKDGGLDYSEKDQETAKKVDLITLPSAVKGTNCFNCKFVKVIDKEKDLGFCNNEQIKLPITSRMCCALWDNKLVHRSWEQKASDGILPIAPMKLKKLPDVNDILKNYKESDLLVQQKFDGWKTQAIKTSGKVKLYSRRGEAFEDNVPDLVKELEKQLKDGDFILGEITYVKDGKQNISDLQTIAGSSKEKSLEFQKNNKGKVILQAYDLLWDAGKNITKSKYIDRYNKLKERIKQSESIKIPKNYTWAQKDEAISDALKSGGEGIVIKPKESEYKYLAKGNSEPVGEWAKFKPSEKANTDEVILKEYHKGKNKLIFPAYQYKDGKLFEVGQLSGLPKEEELQVKNKIDNGKKVVVEVSFQEVLESGKFRHMGFSRVREDKPVKEVKANMKKISIRQDENTNIIDILNNNPELKNIIDSFCMNSGGTKNTHSIINYLRKKMENNLVRFSDKDLINYIEERKKHFKDHHSDGLAADDVGRVGIDIEENYEDKVADYYSHGK